ncbi:hypothetical protein BHE74_00007031 [Ensete ventricosum]|nr:hypothetical protein BHE74_00007031 [Ensete ventricosum]
MGECEARLPYAQRANWRNVRIEHGRSRYAPEQPGPTFPVQKLRTIFAHMLRKKKEKKKKKKKKMEVKKMCK